LHYAVVDFEDRRVAVPANGNEAEWNALKPNTPYGQLPFIEVDGKVAAQSTAILRYVGCKYGLSGEDEWEQMKVDELIDYEMDIMRTNSVYITAFLGMTNGDKDKLRKEVFEPTTAGFLKKLSTLLKETGTGFMVGQKPTIADLLLANYLLTLRNLEADFTDHSDLSEYIDRIHALPQIKSYTDSRKQIIC
ncbi:CRE-GST-5 protein, partial [Aphelenchoides avenae]